MLIYLANLIIVSSLLFISRRIKPQKSKQIFIFFSFLSIVLVAGIRYNVGTDFYMYEKFFFKIHQLRTFSKNFEPAFVIVCKTIRLFTNKSVYLFTVIAIWIYYFIYSVSIKNCKLYDLAIFLFIVFGFFTSSLNILRQWMAIALIFNSFSLLAGKQRVKAALSATLAFLSHYTAVYCIPLFLIICFLKKDSIRMAIIATGITIYPFIVKIFKLLRNIIISLGLNQKYLKYFSDKNIINASFFVMPMFTLVTYIAYYCFLRKKEGDPRQSEFNRFMVNFVVIGFILSVLGTRIHLFERLQFYFCPAIIFLVPNIVENMKLFDNKKIAVLFCLIMGILFYAYSLNQNRCKTASISNHIFR